MKEHEAFYGPARSRTTFLRALKTACVDHAPRRQIKRPRATTRWPPRASPSTTFSSRYCSICTLYPTSVHIICVHNKRNSVTVKQSSTFYHVMLLIPCLGLTLPTLIIRHAQFGHATVHSHLPHFPDKCTVFFFLFFFSSFFFLFYFFSRILSPPRPS